jgi:hypothetical protein
MNLEDETLLSAYLDGELDEEQRLRVELALRSSPRLAEQTHELAAVRDLVSGLPRPALPFDLSAAVPMPRASRGRWFPSRPLSRLGFGLAAAAAILLTMTPGLRPKPQPRPLAVTAGPELARGPHTRGALSTTQPKEAEPSAPVEPESALAASRPAESRVETTRSGEDAEPAPDRDHHPQHIRDYLDSPRLHRVFFVTDVLGGDAGERVNTLIQQTPRTEPVYGRITIGPEIVIDPKHPNRAEVFALMLRDDELPRFKDRLTRAFPDAVEETAPDPVVVTHLSEIGQLAVLSGPTDPIVVVPEKPATIAMRGASKDQTSSVSKGPIVLDPTELNSSDPFVRAHAEAMLRGTANAQENPTPEQERSGGFPTGTLSPRNDPPPPAADEAGRSSIVLVWVTTAREMTNDEARMTKPE